jgi:hypothetical protein
MFSRNCPDWTTPAEVVVATPGAARRLGSRRWLFLILVLGLPVAAQSPGMPPRAQTPGGGRTTDGGASDPDSGFDSRMEAKRIAALNSVRQKSMVSDADKLLQLARQLQDDADAGGTKMSGAERLHKAAEIEKLAKDVKSKMIFAISDSNSVAGPFASWQR